VPSTGLTVPFWSPADWLAAVRPVVAHLAAQGVLAYPTETVYGFGTAVDHASVDALVRMKQRPPHKPFLLLINGGAMLERLGLVLTPSASRLAARFWPGPLTLVLPGGDHRVPARLRGPEGGVAVRWTPHPGLQAILQAYGDAITSTSANRPGVPPAVAAGEIVEQWRDEIVRGRLLVLDGGRLPASPPSTVVDCTGRRPRVIRPGVFSAETLRTCVPDLVGNL
jgi:L-threonylcarbamoyladenylate synthase